MQRNEKKWNKTVLLPYYFIHTSSLDIESTLITFNRFLLMTLMARFVILQQPFSRYLHHRTHREAIRCKAFLQNVLEIIGY